MSESMEREADKHDLDDLNQPWEAASPLREFTPPDLEFLRNGEERTLGLLRRADLAESSVELGSSAFLHVAWGLMEPLVGFLRTFLTTFSESKEQ